MAKTKQPAQPNPSRGGRVRSLFELEEDDDKLLQDLMGRYQKILPKETKATKIFVVRQLLRHVSALKSLPPLR